MVARWYTGVMGFSLAVLLACSPAQNAVGTTGQRAGNPFGSGRVVPVTVAPVIRGAIQSELSYSGTIQADAQVSLYPKVSGRIEKIFVDVGDQVKAGDPLVQLEQAPAALQVKQAQAALAAAQAKLATIKAGARPEDIAAMEAAVRQAQARVDQLKPAESDIAAAEAGLAAAQAQLTKAQNDLAALKAGPDPNNVKLAQQEVERAKAALWSAQTTRDGQCNPRNPAYICNAGNAAAMAAEVAVKEAQTKLDQLLAGPKPEDLANAEKNVQTAEAAVAAAKLKLDQVKAGPRPADLASAQSALDQAKAQLALKKQPYTDEDLKAAQAAVDQAQAALDAAKQALADTTLVAPFDGIVASRNLSPGALATPQTPVLSIVSRAVALFINVEESRIGLIRPGLAVTVTVPAYPTEAFPAKVAGIAPAADAKTHTFPVKITPTTETDKLRTGMFATVKVVTDRHENAVLVPRDALVQVGDNQVVFVARDGQAHRVPIHIGLTDDKNVEALDGLQAGDQVIVTGQIGLNDGDRILVPGQGGRSEGTAGPTNNPARPPGRAGTPTRAPTP